MHSKSYRSISKITKWLVMLSIATIVIALINTGAFFALNYRTRDAQLQGTDLVFLIIAALILVIGIVALIVTLYWFYRANKKHTRIWCERCIFTYNGSSLVVYSHTRFMETT